MQNVENSQITAAACGNTVFFSPRTESKLNTAKKITLMSQIVTHNFPEVLALKHVIGKT